MEPQPRWLTDDEQVTWRSFLLARQLIEDALDRQLQRDSAMPHAYYMILTVLIEADERTLRMRDLAAMLSFSRSRLTHAVTSLERSGWVARRPDPSDGRGQLAVLTDAGRQAQHAAAPGHVAEVRRVLIDRLSAEQVHQLGEISAAILAGEEPPDDDVPADRHR